jgi:hypothetical protein
MSISPDYSQMSVNATTHRRSDVAIMLRPFAIIRAENGRAGACVFRRAPSVGDG